MKITYYGYNTFLIENGDRKIVIDPGKNLGISGSSLLPKDKWPEISHIVVTHNDPDHFDFAIPLAKKSNASIICGKDLVKYFKAEKITKVNSITVNDKINIDNIDFEGLQVEHGTLFFKLAAGLVEMKISNQKRDRGGQEVFLGPLRILKKEKKMDVFNHATMKFLFGLLRAEKDNVEWALGTIGYKITFDGKSIVNLGDTLLRDDWKNLKPDVLMIPIGGLGNNVWTMDVDEAIEAVNSIKPKLVIPCHYSVPFLFNKKFCPADDQAFKKAVEKSGYQCEIMNFGNKIEI
jgi:L-ascorbate metabolism protein UlaG (beta-lactamase superfamily)